MMTITTANSGTQRQLLAKIHHCLVVLLVVVFVLSSRPVASFGTNQRVGCYGHRRCDVTTTNSNEHHPRQLLSNILQATTNKSDDDNEEEGEESSSNSRSKQDRRGLDYTRAEEESSIERTKRLMLPRTVLGGIAKSIQWVAYAFIALSIILPTFGYSFVKGADGLRIGTVEDRDFQLEINKTVKQEQTKAAAAAAAAVATPTPTPTTQTSSAAD